MRAHAGDWPRIRLRVRDHTPLSEVGHVLFKTYRQRTLVGLTLMAAQAFFYNAIFFTYALVLTNFYAIPAGEIGWYILPFAAGNVFGPIVLGRLFDTIGRKVMIAATYALIGYPAGRDRLSLQPEPADGADAHHRLDARFLLCLGGGELRLSDGERDFPAGDSSACHRVLLCGRYRRRRRGGTVAIGRADQYRIARQRRHWLSHWGAVDDCGRRRARRSGASPPRASRSRPSPGRCLLSNHNGI